MSRTYWVGLPVGITVRDDGGVSIEVDMSEASSEMADLWAESEEADWGEEQALLDAAIVDGHPTRSSAAAADLPAALLGLMSCPVAYRCRFKTSQLHEMAAHISFGDHREA